jgi:hypothetical protein
MNRSTMASQQLQEIEPRQIAEVESIRLLLGQFLGTA